VVRGGSWNSSAWRCRSADRDSIFNPDDRDYEVVGFRVLLAPGQ
jgi:formylglycine-generating enzyme required for sulfatase activity